MLNSVSISWLLPSLQQRSRERSTNPQKSSGFDRRSVQSFIPRPRAMELCQQTFHWNHIKPLLFPQFCTFPALPLSLSISLCRFILHFLFLLLPLSMCFYLPLPFFFLTLYPLGFLGLCCRGFSTLFKLLCLPPRTWQHSGNLLSCSPFMLVSPPSWHTVKLWSDLKIQYAKFCLK